MADLVALTTGPTSWQVAAVYPHQTVFSSGPGANAPRRFDLRGVTCTMDTSGALTAGAVDTIHPNVRFDGQIGDGTGVGAAGLILPDLAPSAPGSGRFVLTFEEQWVDPQTSIRHGRIRLELVELTSAGFDVLSRINFQDPQTEEGLRRPMVSSRPSAFPGQEVVSLCWGILDHTTYDRDSTVASWVLDDGNGGSHALPLQLWPNTPVDADDRPVVVQGEMVGTTGLPFRRTCLDRTPSGNSDACHLYEFDPNSGSQVLWYAAPTGQDLARPAASYFHDPGLGDPHLVAVTWEETDPARSGEEGIRLTVR